MKEKSVRLVVLGIMLVLLASAAVGTASAKQEGNIFTPDYKPKDDLLPLSLDYFLQHLLLVLVWVMLMLLVLHLLII